MEILESAVLTSKGQLTVPSPIRDIFGLKKGSVVIFKITEKGIFFMPGEIKPKDSYTREEWEKVEKLVAEQGRVYASSRGARKHLRSL
ncbi:MAG: AbrB/MazE/SpoVT family DNA-binding domain-containing protein [Candidatus Aminicenantes bacterium]|nr:AbrB/MazE/SpoVT family DNA-binding domain-containing protein [Candidatus Aminicenantes bacterium]